MAIVAVAVVDLGGGGGGGRGRCTPRMGLMYPPNGGPPGNLKPLIGGLGRLTYKLIFQNFSILHQI